jgi:hypothetical protein
MHPDVFSQLHALVGAGVVAYEVSQVQDSVRSMLKVTDHSLKGLDVGMDIRKNRHPHAHSIQSPVIRSINALTVPALIIIIRNTSSAERLFIKIPLIFKKEE